MGLFSLYTAWGENIRLVFLSPDPSFDSAFLRRFLGCKDFAVLTPPLPAGIASRLLKTLEERFPFPREGSAEPPPLDGLRRFCLRQTASLPYPLQKNFPPFETVASKKGPSDGIISRDELDEVETVLRGRLLTPGEIGRILRLGNAAGRTHLNRVLQALCLTGRAALLPAVIPVKGDLVRCQRCGWEGIPVLRPCKGCGSRACCGCPDCLILGEIGLCGVLYTAPVPSLSLEEAGDPSKGMGRRCRIGRIFSGRFAGKAGGRDVVCLPVTQGDAYPSGWEPGRAAGRTASPANGRGETVAGTGRYRIGITFTPAQEAAVQALLRFGNRDAPGSICLVWAACGAGKTEVSFPLIGQALNRGQKVLFATPRRDVVLEIAPRLEKTFGGKNTAALYGGCKNRDRDAPLIAATTHQVLRFYRGFDLVILDEGDAYPYPGSRMLHFGVKRALRPGGKLVYLTATPAGWMLEQGRSGIVDIIRIPARPHGFPLPEPRFLKVAPLQKTSRGTVLHRAVLELIGTILEKDGGRIFIFVPSVELTRLVGEALRSAAGRPPLEGIFPERIQWSHAGDRERDRKREGFLKGEFPILVTTTIMERGITVPRVHVLVLEADRSAVFDRPSLVQMAGRCGRSPDYPTGQVWFVARSIGGEMEEALREIRSLNDEAFHAGYLLDDYEDRLREILNSGWQNGVASESS